MSNIAIKKFCDNPNLENFNQLSRREKTLFLYYSIYCLKNNIGNHIPSLINNFYNPIDKVMGLFYCAGIGDALGAPIEFRRVKPKLPFTGTIREIDVTIQFQYVNKILKKGSVTDDSEMTFILFRSILENKGYDRDKTVVKYMNWANYSPFIGKNTRALLKGVKTLRGYNGRVEKMKENNEWGKSESNGTLMRCSSLALLNNWKEASNEDCSITNDNNINKECNLVLLSKIRYFLFGKEEEIIIKTPEVLKVLKSIENNEVWDVSGKQKGWCCHALHVALSIIRDAKSFTDGIIELYKRYCSPNISVDIDTIMSITGSLLGAKFGFKSLLKTENKNVRILEENNSEWFNSTLEKDITKVLKMTD